MLSDKCSEGELIATLLEQVTNVLDQARQWQTHEGCHLTYQTIEAVLVPHVQTYCEYHAEMERNHD
jgi:hypothetical protein